MHVHRVEERGLELPGDAIAFVLCSDLCSKSFHLLATLLRDAIHVKLVRALHSLHLLLKHARHAVHPTHGVGHEADVNGGARLAATLCLEHLFL
jgi:hypothetical protein